MKSPAAALAVSFSLLCLSLPRCASRGFLVNAYLQELVNCFLLLAFFGVRGIRVFHAGQGLLPAHNLCARLTAFWLRAREVIWSERHPESVRLVSVDGRQGDLFKSFSVVIKGRRRGKARWRRPSERTVVQRWRAESRLVRARELPPIGTPAGPLQDVPIAKERDGARAGPVTRSRPPAAGDCRRCERAWG